MPERKKIILLPPAPGHTKKRVVFIDFIPTDKLLIWPYPVYDKFTYTFPANLK